jgi:hypothetical protein
MRRRLHSLRMTERSKLTTNNQIQTEVISQDLGCFRVYVQSNSAQPWNLKLLRNELIVPCRAKIDCSITQKGDKGAFRRPERVPRA